MQLLKPEDVPGAILKTPDNTLEELKRWLLCRSLPCTGKKSDLIFRYAALLLAHCFTIFHGYHLYFRIENCIKNGMDNDIHPGVNNGIWFELRFPTEHHQTLIAESWLDQIFIQTNSNDILFKYYTGIFREMQRTHGRL